MPKQKDLKISMLYDFYGDLLTEKQQEVIEFYYNEDLSLAEIAEHSGITRQGVRDSIKRAEGQLLEFEEQLGLAERFKRIQSALESITGCAQEICIINAKFHHSKEIAERADKIRDLAAALTDE